MGRRRILKSEPNHADTVGDGGRRRGRRIPVVALVTLNADTKAVEAMACDVSETGLRISLESPPPPGPITVKMVGLPILTGEVRWSNTRHIGVLLGQPIASDFLATWVKVHGNRR